MTARETDSMSDDAFDARLRRLLELDTRDVPGAPSRDDAVTRLAIAVGPSGDATGVRGRTSGQPLLRTILVLGALAALIAGAIAIGTGRTNDDVLVVAPSQSPATSPIATAQQAPLSSLCQGGTRATDIRTLAQPVSTEPRWVADPPPTSARPIAPREIAVVGRATTDESSQGVYLLDVATGSTCLLVELPPGQSVANMMWAPSGDALALQVDIPDRNVSVMHVWSALGIKAMTVGGIFGSSSLWAPDGSSILTLGGGAPVIPSGLQLVPADGSTPLQFVCEPDRASPCPAAPRVHWSPDGSHISLHGGDRWAPGLFSIAALADRQMLPLDTGLEAPDIEGWLDPDTLLVSSRNDLFRVPISDPRAWLAYAPGTYARSDFRHDQVSPDLAFAALEPAEFDDGLDVIALATGRSTTAVRPADVGDDLAISQFQWAPTSDAIAFTLMSKLGVVPGLWVVDRDGTGLRQVSTVQIEASQGETSFAWRPAWP